MGKRPRCLDRGPVVKLERWRYEAMKADARSWHVHELRLEGFRRWRHRLQRLVLVAICAGALAGFWAQLLSLTGVIR